MSHRLSAIVTNATCDRYKSEGFDCVVCCNLSVRVRHMNGSSFWKNLSLVVGCIHSVSTVLLSALRQMFLIGT